MVSIQTFKKARNLLTKTWFFAFATLSVFLFFSSCVEGANKDSNDTADFKVRALWVDPPGFANRAAVDTMIEKCQRAGINTILVDIMLRGDVYFKSNNFIGNVNANDQFDPLEYVIEKAHAANIKVQAWSCVYYSKPKSADWVMKPFIDKNYDHVFLSPAHPEVNPYLLSVLKELLNYDIDGIHLDYTRYWNAAFDYSDVACNRFKESYGFNPQDFLDHPERIVSSEKESYPIRVLCTNTMAGSVSAMGTVERNMNRTEQGYAFISEQPINIDALKTPGLMIVTYLTEVSSEMVQAFKRYVERGGDIIWIDPDNRLFTKYPELELITGIKGASNLKSLTQSVHSVDETPFEKLFTSIQMSVRGSSLVLGQANVVGRLSSGEPIVTIHRKGKGNFMTIGFRIMENHEPPVIQLLKDMISWFRTESGASDSDLMAEKRRQWIDWRANHILEFVKEVNKMVKEKDSGLVVTAAAGVGPQQYDGVYRDGGQWLVEDLCDYIFPMNYTDRGAMNDTDRINSLEGILKEQIFFTPKGMSNRIYPGLRMYFSKENGFGPMNAETVRKQLETVKKYDYEGFCLFSYSHLSDEIIKVVGSFANDIDD